MDRALSHLTKMRMRQENLRTLMAISMTLIGRNAARDRFIGIENSIYILIIETEIELNESKPSK